MSELHRSAKAMKILHVLLCFGVVVCAGVIVIGAVVVRSIVIGEVYEVHRTEVSSVPALEVRVSGFVDGTFDLYRSRVGWPVHLLHLPCLKSTVLPPPVGDDLPSNARVQMGPDFTWNDPMYRAHWSEDGRRVGVSFHGTYVAAYDFESNSGMSLREGSTAQSPEFHLKVRQFLEETRQAEPGATDNPGDAQ